MIGALLALSFATKETTFITVFVMGSFFLFALAVAAARATAGLGAPVSGVRLGGLGLGLAAFAGVFTLLFTTFLTHPHGLWDGICTGLKYWLDQQGVGRGGEPWYFYASSWSAMEWPALLLGTIGAVSLLRRPHAASARS